MNSPFHSGYKYVYDEAITIGILAASITIIYNLYSYIHSSWKTSQYRVKYGYKNANFQFTCRYTPFVCVSRFISSGDTKNRQENNRFSLPSLRKKRKKNLAPNSISRRKKFAITITPRHQFVPSWRLI
jgi:hypothetical protein